VRRPIVAANWKMNKTAGEALALAGEIRRRLAGLDAVEVVICPPFTALGLVGERLGTSGVALGAQNAHAEPSGAFTGEVSAPMLADLGCAWVIVGHSERRTLCGETDRDVNRKARAVLAAGMRPIVCVGETLDERERGATEDVLARQLAGSLAGLEPDLARIVLAYEPVWAIGTGRTATPEQAQEAHAFLRQRIAEGAGHDAALALRIQYGGSVKPDNARALFELPDVDGGLIGGASLDAASFEAIVRAAAPQPES
jgi:triosephosphate isomerase